MTDRVCRICHGSILEGEEWHLKENLIPGTWEPVHNKCSDEQVKKRKGSFSPRLGSAFLKK